VIPEYTLHDARLPRRSPRLRLTLWRIGATRRAAVELPLPHLGSDAKRHDERHAHGANFTRHRIRSQHERRMPRKDAPDCDSCEMSKGQWLATSRWPAGVQTTHQDNVVHAKSACPHPFSHAFYFATPPSREVHL
jgi:hypothetical protein